MEKQQEQQRTEQEELKDIITSREDGFGYRLKLARQEKDLSTLDVARELRLEERIIVALECEDHARLPASAFVCGYIRNYAKYMNMQPEPLIDSYKRELSNEGLDPELKITKEKKVNTGIDISQLIAPVSFIFVVLVLGVGGWFLWGFFTKDSNDIEISESLMESTESIETQQTMSPDNDPGSLSLPVPSDTYVSVEETTDSNEVPESTETSLSSETTDVQEMTGEKEIVIPTVEAKPEQVDMVTSKPLADIAEPADEAPVTVVPDDQLVLEFSGNSWIVIKDANDKKLASGLKKAGETLYLKGKTPYNIFLGDARVVTVSIHGKIFDHAHFINDKNIARFVVE